MVQVSPGVELGSDVGGSVGGVAGGSGGGALCVPPPSPLGLVLGVGDGLVGVCGLGVDEVAALLDGVLGWAGHSEHGSGPRSSELTLLMQAQPMD
jgi:hypothetical protein